MFAASHRDARSVEKSNERKGVPSGRTSQMAEIKEVRSYGTLIQRGWFATDLMSLRDMVVYLDQFN
jgi:hypothetical protein